MRSSWVQKRQFAIDSTASPNRFRSIAAPWVGNTRSPVFRWRVCGWKLVRASIVSMSSGVRGRRRGRECHGDRAHQYPVEYVLALDDGLGAPATRSGPGDVDGPAGQRDQSAIPGRVQSAVSLVATVAGSVTPSRRLAETVTSTVGTIQSRLTTDGALAVLRGLIGPFSSDAASTTSSVDITKHNFKWHTRMQYRSLGYLTVYRTLISKNARVQ